MKTKLKAQFPAFGGKARVASLVWDRIGDVANAIEPFANSAAWLLARPHPPRIETLNDQNCYIANYWRAVQADPDVVAEHADWPVNEADLHARHRWLVLSREAAEFRRSMRTDPDYFDARVAGWWVWGACCWIGSGWCEESELRANGTPREKTPHPDARGIIDRDLAAKRPILAGAANEHGERTHLGLGVHKKRPCLGGGGNGGGAQEGRGVHAKGPSEQRPILACGADGHGGQGIHADRMTAHRPQLADAYARGRGVHGNDSAGTCEARRAWLVDWTRRLSDRLRTVRVCCGDWERVCGSPSVTTRLGVTGIFLDPPYPTHSPDGTESRSAGLYGADDSGDDLDKLRDRVLGYCVGRGADPLMRIAVCGYDTDGYAALEALGWSVVAWKASGGYGNRSDKGKANAGRERIWFSPACVPAPDRRRRDLPGQLSFLDPVETARDS